MSMGVPAFRNPFLDTLFEWGKDEFWHTINQMYGILDGVYLTPTAHISSGRGWVSKFKKDFADYEGIEWYFASGVEADIGAFSFLDPDDVGGLHASDIGELLIDDQRDGVDWVLVRFHVNRLAPVYSAEWQKLVEINGWKYENIPQELTHQDQRGWECLPVIYGPGYVQLVEVDGVWANSLYFTMEKGKGWPYKIPKNLALNYPQGVEL